MTATPSLERRALTIAIERIVNLALPASPIEVRDGFVTGVRDLGDGLVDVTIDGEVLCTIPRAHLLSAALDIAHEIRARSN